MILAALFGPELQRGSAQALAWRPHVTIRIGSPIKTFRPAMSFNSFAGSSERAIEHPVSVCCLGPVNSQSGWHF